MKAESEEKGALTHFVRGIRPFLHMRTHE